MTFTELMALDKKPDQAKPTTAQTVPNDTAPESKTERSVRPERAVRNERAERPNRNEHPVRPVRVTSSPDSVEPPRKREIRRHSFEFYRDQIDRLRELRIEVMKSGREASMSAMVREALDDYIDKQD